MINEKIEMCKIGKKTLTLKRKRKGKQKYISMENITHLKLFFFIILAKPESFPD